MRVAVGGPPCVAQRVWPMPVRPSLIGCAASSSVSLTSLPAFFAVAECAVVIDHRDAGGVVAAVFEPTKAADEHFEALVRADISNDSTHGLDFSWARPATKLLAMSDPARTNGVHGHSSPFVELDRADWAALARSTRCP